MVQKEVTMRSTGSDHHHAANERGVDIGPPIGVEPYDTGTSSTTIAAAAASGSSLCHTGHWMPTVSGGVGAPSGAFGTSASGTPYTKTTGFMDNFLGCIRPLGCMRPFSFVYNKSSVIETDGGAAAGVVGIGHYQRDQWEIPFEEILELEWVGSGAQGTVFSGKLQDEIVAVKKVRDLKETDIKHLRKLDHENIIKFK